jgi:hypothetical protein
VLNARFCKGTFKGHAGKSVSTVTLAPGGCSPAEHGDLILDSPTMLACSKVPFPTQLHAETTLRKVARRNAAVGKKVPTGTDLPGVASHVEVAVAGRAVGKVVVMVQT